MREAPKCYSGSFDPADLLSPSILELEKVSAHVNRSDFRHSFIGQYIWPLADFNVLASKSENFGWGNEDKESHMRVAFRVSKAALGL